MLGAGFVDRDWRFLLWVAALLTVGSSTFLNTERGFGLSSGHFVERHALVIIVALGESVVAIGVGASGLEIDAALAVTALLGLALSASLWWVYFDQDDTIAETVMTNTDGHVRARLGLTIGYVHVVMIAGIVLAAAGVKVIVAHPTDPAETAGAWNLAVGIAVYLVGESLFRSRLGVVRWLAPIAVSLGAVATVPLGLAVSGLAQLGAVVALLVVLILVERR